MKGGKESKEMNEEWLKIGRDPIGKGWTCEGEKVEVGVNRRSGGSEAAKGGICLPSQQYRVAARAESMPKESLISIQ